VQRFEFRLERVLKLKKQREWLAELHQKQARAALDVARAELAVVHEQIAHSAALLQAGLAAAGCDALWLSRHQQVLRLAPRLELAEAKLQQADVKYREASAARTQIATEVEALEHLRQEEAQTHRLAVLRAQQEQLDEVGMRLWRAGQDGTPAPP
jgi:flagellar export protein FliJ